MFNKSENACFCSRINGQNEAIMRLLIYNMKCKSVNNAQIIHICQVRPKYKATNYTQ